jgi:hypothetical protein
MKAECRNRCLTITIGKRPIFLTANYCPGWETPKLAFHENGGRQANECLDLNWSIWRMAFSVTICNLGGLSRVLRFIPTKPRSGYSIGWF